MESNKQTYAEFLNESEVFADWLKQIPFNFDLCRLFVNDDNSVTMVFKNSLDTEYQRISLELYRDKLFFLL